MDEFELIPKTEEYCAGSDEFTKSDEKYFLIEKNKKFSKSSLRNSPERISELLGYMYTLRAGMSAILLEKDKLPENTNLQINTSTENSYKKCLKQYIKDLFCLIGIILLCLLPFAGLGGGIAIFVLSCQGSIHWEFIFLGIAMFIVGGFFAAIIIAILEDMDTPAIQTKRSFKALKEAAKNRSNEIKAIKNNNSATAQKFATIYLALDQELSCIINELNWVRLDVATWRIVLFKANTEDSSDEYDALMKKEIHASIVQQIEDIQSNYNYWIDNTTCGKTFKLCCNRIAANTLAGNGSVDLKDVFSCKNMFDALYEKRYCTSEQLYSVTKSVVANK